MAREMKEHHRHAKRAAGGKVKDRKGERVKGNLYDAAGAPESREAEDTKGEGFRRGGHVKRKEGGEVHGEREKHNTAKRARGGHVGKHKEHHKEHHKGHFARGGSPYSSAHSLEAAGRDNSGHEGEGAKEEP